MNTNAASIRRSQLICFWMGPIGMSIFFYGLWPLAGLLPPNMPSWGAQEVVAFYQGNHLRFQIGLAVMIISLGLQVPFQMLIVAMMARMNGISPALRHTVFAIFVMDLVFTFIPLELWAAVAFRPDRDPQLLHLVNDMGWLCFVTPVGGIVIQAFVLGLAILMDTTRPSICPRWAGWFSIWFATLSVPGGLAIIFKTGPFAWNGILAFWVPLVLGGIWTLILYVCVWKDIKRQYQEAVGSPVGQHVGAAVRA